MLATLQGTSLVAQNAPRQNAETFAEIVKVQGRGVALKRVGAQKWEPQAEFAQGSRVIALSRGDLMRVQKGSIVLIRCKNEYKPITRQVPDDGIAWGVTSACSPPRQRR